MLTNGMCVAGGRSLGASTPPLAAAHPPPQRSRQPLSLLTRHSHLQLPAAAAHLPLPLTLCPAHPLLSSTCLRYPHLIRRRRSPYPPLLNRHPTAMVGQLLSAGEWRSAAAAAAAAAVAAGGSGFMARLGERRWGGRS